MAPLFKTQPRPHSQLVPRRPRCRIVLQPACSVQGRRWGTSRTGAHGDLA
jgi:hypothetical protein